MRYNYYLLTTNFAVCLPRTGRHGPECKDDVHPSQVGIPLRIKGDNSTITYTNTAIILCKKCNKIVKVEDENEPCNEHALDCLYNKGKLGMLML